MLNSKSECNNARIPRIVIEEGEKQVEDRESGLGKQVEKEKTKRDKERNKMTEVRKRNEKRGVETEEIDRSRDRTKRLRRESTDVETNTTSEKCDKKKSRETETHQKEVRKNKKQRENEHKLKVREESQTAGIEYWRGKFQQMAEKNRERLSEVEKRPPEKRLSVGGGVTPVYIVE